MVPELRRAFNAHFTEQRYRDLLRDLEGEAGHPIGFRVCETPLFLTAELTRELTQAVRELADAVTSPEYLQAAERAVPPGLSVPGENAHTTFLQIDFALVRGEDGGYLPQLIELQGFPSLYSFQWLLEWVIRRHYDLPAEFSPISPASARAPTLTACAT